MILTVTLNAAIDRTVAVPSFRQGNRHRAVEASTVAGGKGVNVARALKLPPRFRQQIAAGFGGFDREFAVDAATLHQPLVDGILPDGQPRTARLPRIHDVGIASRAGRHPLHKIKHQGIGSVIHAVTIAILGLHIQYMG